MKQFLFLVTVALNDFESYADGGFEEQENAVSAFSLREALATLEERGGKADAVKLSGAWHKL